MTGAGAGLRRILVAVDGSDNALRAVRHVLAEKDVYRDPIHVVLVNVQASVVSGAVKMFLDPAQIDRFYREEGETALAAARDLVAAAGVPTEHHILVGDPAENLDRIARDTGCRQIVMGTRGLGAITGMFLGSVAAKVVHRTQLPVLLVP